MSVDQSSFFLGGGAIEEICMKQCEGGDKEPLKQTLLCKNVKINESISRTGEYIPGA